MDGDGVASGLVDDALDPVEAVPGLSAVAESADFRFVDRADKQSDIPGGDEWVRLHCDGRFFAMVTGGVPRGSVPWSPEGSVKHADQNLE
jgi:hypothetical protein